MDAFETTLSRLVSFFQRGASNDAPQRARFQRRDAYTHHPDQPGVDPTRYGDWEYNGRCTDFC